MPFYNWSQNKTNLKVPLIIYYIITDGSRYQESLRITLEWNHRRVLALLPRGGFAKVIKAQDKKTGKMVAVKIIKK